MTMHKGLKIRLHKLGKKLWKGSSESGDNTDLGRDMN